MVIDTSALLAILFGESECRTFIEAIESADSCSVSVVNFVETSMVLESRHGAEDVRDFDLFLSKAGITIVPVDLDPGHMARQAFQQYGKGRHPARLNFGDCFAYALAKSLDQPLLYKGEDFSQSDIASAART